MLVKALVGLCHTFITPNVLAVLVKNFDIKPIAATPEGDLRSILEEGCKAAQDEVASFALAQI